VVKLKTNNYQNLPYGTTPLKKIPSVTQTSLLVGKRSMFGPLSRTEKRYNQKLPKTKKNL
jgi:hypothetical protein